VAAGAASRGAVCRLHPLHQRRLPTRTCGARRQTTAPAAACCIRTAPHLRAEGQAKCAMMCRRYWHDILSVLHDLLRSVSKKRSGRGIPERSLEALQQQSEECLRCFEMRPDGRLHLKRVSKDSVQSLNDLDVYCSTRERSSQSFIECSRCLLCTILYREVPCFSHFEVTSLTAAVEQSTPPCPGGLLRTEFVAYGARKGWCPAEFQQSDIENDCSGYGQELPRFVPQSLAARLQIGVCEADALLVHRSRAACAAARWLVLSSQARMMYCKDINSPT
jgi:hypothetical protein